MNLFRKEVKPKIYAFILSARHKEKGGQSNVLDLRVGYDFKELVDNSIKMAQKQNPEFDPYHLSVTMELDLEDEANKYLAEKVMLEKLKQ